jgi:hypothetical protein
MSRNSDEFASLRSHSDVSRYHFVPREESLSRRTRVSTTTMTGIERETSRCVRRRSLTREYEYCARLRDRVRRPLPPQRSTEIAERGRVARDPPTEPRPPHSLRSPCSEQVQRGAVVASGVASRHATRMTTPRCGTLYRVLTRFVGISNYRTTPSSSNNVSGKLMGFYSSFGGFANAESPGYSHWHRRCCVIMSDAFS